MGSTQPSPVWKGLPGLASPSTSRARQAPPRAGAQGVPEFTGALGSWRPGREGGAGTAGGARLTRVAGRGHKMSRGRRGQCNGFPSATWHMVQEHVPEGGVPGDTAAQPGQASRSRCGQSCGRGSGRWTRAWGAGQDSVWEQRRKADEASGPKHLLTPGGGAGGEGGGAMHPEMSGRQGGYPVGRAVLQTE